MWWWWWWVVQVVAWWCAGLVAVLCWLWATRPRVDAPGPPTLPIIGNILDVWQLPVTLRKFRDFHHQYGDFRLYLGPKLMMVVAHPDDVEHILLTCKVVDRDPYIRHALRIFAGDSIIANSGIQWKTHRKLINRVFHSELLEGFLGAFHQSGVFLCERLARARGTAMAVYPPAFLVALRIICELVIGIDPDLLISDASAEEEFSAAMVDSIATMQTMVMRPWLQSKFLLRMTPKARSLFNYTRLLEDWAMKCIAVRSAETEEGPPKKHLTLLESLVKPGGQTALPLNEVKNAIMNVIVAGSEASAVTVSFTLAALALHPEWQEAARRELREVFGEGEDYLRAPNMADLGRLRVLDSIIKETLRLFPAVPAVPRVALEDLWLPRARVRVPKGAMLFVASFVTHRLPEFFPEPLKFDPSRFLDGGAGKQHPCCYLPFGGGPRGCVGSQYAGLQLKVLLAEVVRRFRLEPHTSWEDLEQGTLSVTQHPTQPIKVCCVPLRPPST